MKKNLFYILLIVVNASNAQPASNDKIYVMQRIQDFEKITDSLSKNPKNYELIWERTEMLFSPYFNMYQKPNDEIENDSESVRNVFTSFRTLKYKNIDVLDELNKLLINVDSLKNFTRNNLGEKTWVNKSNFYYRRGQYYYLKNELKKSLADYLTALNYNPDKNTKSRICLSIAAYYFTYDFQFDSTNSGFKSQLNLEKALEYIDMISPQFDKKIYDFPTSQQFQIISYSNEKEKLELLKMTKQNGRLANYHINKTQSLFNLYNKLVNESKDISTVNIDEREGTLKSAIESLTKSQYYLINKNIEFRITNK